ncbi:MAG: hypothetical protein OXT65_00050, partial [Alphaproteobacteria bacterium]|nr:hypothetical protein [Alphaproteobacteria bacterium]
MRDMGPRYEAKKPSINFGKSVRSAIGKFRRAVLPSLWAVIPTVAASTPIYLMVQDDRREEAARTAAVEKVYEGKADWISRNDTENYGDDFSVKLKQDFKKESEPSYYYSRVNVGGTVIGVDAELTNQEGIPKPSADKEAEESYLVEVEK